MPYYSYGYGYDSANLVYLILLVPVLLLSLYAQAAVSGNFSRYSKVTNRRGLTGAQAAAGVLRAHGITDVGIARYSQPILLLGIVLFGVVAFFQLVTLPVEFNASHRALETLEGEHILEDEEMAGARKVLRAAALTYVAALLSSLLQLLRYVLIFLNRSGNRRGGRR